MSDLSSYLRVSNGNVTGIVDRLVDEGLALRLAVPGDKRANLARLTPKGAAVFETLALQHKDWVDGLLGGLTESEAQTLMTLLKKAQLGASALQEDGHDPA
jgi:DNA-binding MarR family transcriptional regulator